MIYTELDLNVITITIIIIIIIVIIIIILIIIIIIIIEILISSSNKKYKYSRNHNNKLYFCRVVHLVTKLVIRGALIQKLKSKILHLKREKSAIGEDIAAISNNLISIFRNDGIFSQSTCFHTCSRRKILKKRNRYFKNDLHKMLMYQIAQSILPLSLLPSLNGKLMKTQH